MWELRNPQPFDRDTVGRIDLYLRKDREGCLGKTVTFSVGGSGDGSIVFSRSTGTVETPDEGGLLPRQRTAEVALEALAGSAKTKEWQEQAKAAGMSRRTFFRAKGELVDMGRVSAANGHNSLSSANSAKPVSWHQMAPSTYESANSATTLEGGTMALSAGTASDRIEENSKKRRWLTEEEVIQYQRLREEGMQPKEARAKVLGEDA